MLEKVHHINLLVRDLDAAIERDRETLGITTFSHGDLAQRGVRTARFQVGETWLVLVQPTDPNGVPGRHLAEHGEGLFLLSLQTDDLDATVEEIRARGGQFTSEQPRQGLEDWRVIDLERGQFFGSQIQLVESQKDV